MRMKRIVSFSHYKQLEAENEAKAAMEKNISRRMGWFDMIRRLEKKVANGLDYLFAIIVQKRKWLRMEDMT